MDECDDRNEIHREVDAQRAVDDFESTDHRRANRQQADEAEEEEAEGQRVQRVDDLAAASNELFAFQVHRILEQRVPVVHVV